MLQALKKFLGISDRTQLTATCLWNYLLDTNGFEKSTQKSIPNGSNQNKPHYISRTKDNQQIIITRPAYNIQNDAFHTSAEPLTEVLSTLSVDIESSRLDTKEIKILVPLCETSKKIFGENHFILLEISISKTKTNVTLHDSKTISFYNRTQIYAACNPIQDWGHYIEYSHSNNGSQSIFNRTDCGRFVIAGINQIINGDKRSPGAALSDTTEEKLQNIESKIERGKAKIEYYNIRKKIIDDQSKDDIGLTGKSLTFVELAKLKNPKDDFDLPDHKQHIRRLELLKKNEQQHLK